MSSSNADGHILIDTTVDSDGLKTGMQGLGSIAQSGIKVVTAALAAGTAAVTAFIAESVKIGSSFEAAMSEVSAISGATGDDLVALTEKAKEMGAVTKFSASESAEALKYMAMAGWKTEDMLNGLSGIMDLAAASGEELGTVSDIVTDALTAFGLKASDSGHFADVLATASSNANTNVGLMGATFKYVGPLAGAMGYSIEDLATGIGLMANAGIKGEMAGTQLRAMITNMVKPTDAMAVAMDKLGLSITDSAGNVKPFNELMLDLRDSFSGLSDAEKTQYAATIAGKEAMSGMLAIVNASDEDFAKLTDAINNADGAADRMASTMQDNLQGRMEELGGGLETVKIQIYESLEKSLKKAADNGIKSVDKLSRSLKSSAWTSAIDKIGKGIESLSEKAADFAADAIPKLVEGIAWVIENGETLIDVAASVVAGIAAFQIVSTAGGWFNAASLQIQLFTAANGAAALSNAALTGTLSASEVVIGILTGKITLATAAQAAWNAVLAANPLVLVAAGVAVAVTAIVGLSVALGKSDKALKENADRLKAMADKAKDTAQASKDLRDSGQEARDSIAAESETAKALASRLQVLADKTGKTAEEKAEMASIVAELNEVMPGLELAYDAETDALEGNIEAIYANIEAREKQLMAEQMIAENASLLQEQTTLYNDLKTAQMELTEATTAYSNALYSNEMMLAGYPEYAGYTVAELENLKTAQENAQTSVDTLTDQYMANETQIANNRQAIGDYTIEQQKATEAQEAATQVTGVFVRGQYDLSQAIEKAGLSAEDAGKKYDSYAENTQNAFGKIEQDSKISIEKMTKNLESNQKLVEDWSKNLAILAERGLNGGLIAKLREAGPESAKTVKGLVDASDEELKKLDDVFTNGADVAAEALMRELGLPEVTNSGSKMVDDIASGVDSNTSLEKSAGTMIRDTKTVTVNAVRSNNFSAVGSSIASGIAEGIKNGQNKVVQAAVDAVRAAEKGARSAAEVNSPSKLFAREIGAPLAEGIAFGFSKESARSISDMQDAMYSQQEALSKTALSGKSAPVSYGASADDSAAGNVTFSGGINIYTDTLDTDQDWERAGQKLGDAFARQARYKGVMIGADG